MFGGLRVGWLCRLLYFWRRPFVVAVVWFGISAYSGSMSLYGIDSWSRSGLV